MTFLHHCQAEPNVQTTYPKGLLETGIIIEKDLIIEPRRSWSLMFEVRWVVETGG